MENGGSGSEYHRISAAFAEAKAQQRGGQPPNTKPTKRESAATKQKEWEYKVSHILLTCFFGLIILLHLFGIYLFTSGFLLTRLVLPHKSTCDAPPLVPYSSYKAGSVDTGCWHPKAFKKAVVILIDALRYDFTVPHSRQGLDGPPAHYHDALPIFYETAVEHPNNAFLLPFIADPPTATLQRLKGLTTGTLPTFVDIGSNFAGTAIEEDNLIAQLRDLRKTVVHLGDDTWHALFPGYFEPNLTKPYDSFNVWDLHTVDNGVNTHLFPLLAPDNRTKWDVAIGHYLGVDHAGHRYGPDHPAMAAKLQQMDDVVRRLIPLIDDDTLLVVMGDHGMDAKGDHGGESDDEVQAALWMYTKRPVFGRAGPGAWLPPPTARERPVGQIDLVPTLALLLGLPVPFNNLGAPIVEAFIGPDGTDLENLARVNSMAAAQIHRYQHEYAQVRNLEESATARPRALWENASEAWSTLTEKKGKPNVGQWQAAADAFSAYQVGTLAMCKSLWARFDVPSMIYGIVIQASTMLIIVVYARGLALDRTTVSPGLVAHGAVLTVGGFMGGASVSTAFPTAPFIQTTVIGSALGATSGILLSLWRIRKSVTSPLPRSVLGSVSALFPLLLSIGFASNSFTIWEDRILLFFLSSIGALLVALSLRQPSLADRVRGGGNAALFTLLTRVAGTSRLCREEQMPHCVSTYYASTASSTSAGWQLAIPFAVALLLPVVVQSYYHATRSYQSSAVLWIGVAFRAGLFLSALFWTLDAADDGGWFGGWGGSGTTGQSGALKTIRVMVAQVVLAIAFAAGYSTFVWAPPLVKVETTAVRQSSSDETTAASGSEQARPAVAILGHANVHGSRYFLLVTVWALAAILVSKPMGGGALALEVWSVLALAEALDACRLTISPSSSRATKAPATAAASASAIGPVALALLGLFHFFTTGHQAALSSIQWESAFVPLHTLRYPWAPLMVALNTFAGPLLAAVSVPVVVLWKRPVATRGPAHANGSGEMRRMLSDVAVAVATFVAVYALVGLATAAWAAWLRRHLMLFRIFNPRFMLGALSLVFVELVSVFVALGGCWWSFGSVAEAWGW